MPSHRFRARRKGRCHLVSGADITHTCCCGLFSFELQTCATGALSVTSPFSPGLKGACTTACSCTAAGGEGGRLCPAEHHQHQRAGTCSHNSSRPGFSHLPGRERPQAATMAVNGCQRAAGVTTAQDDTWGGVPCFLHTIKARMWQQECASSNMTGMAEGARACTRFYTSFKVHRASPSCLR